MWKEPEVDPRDEHAIVRCTKVFFKKTKKKKEKKKVKEKKSLVEGCLAAHYSLLIFF